MKANINRARIVASLAGFAAAMIGPAPLSAEISFDLEPSYVVELFPTSVAGAHLDGDDLLDLVVTNADQDTVSVLLNAGNGTFAPAVGYPTGLGPFAVAVGDVDGDGDMDLAVVNKSANNVSILVNNGAGTFTAGSTLDVGSAPRSIVAADLDHDEDIDLAVSNKESNTVSVLLNIGGGVFALAEDYAAGLDLRQIVVGYFDEDTHLDLAVASHGTTSVHILLNAGNGAFGSSVTIPLDSADKPEAMAVGDFNGDGLPDLAVTAAGTPSGTVLVIMNNGNASFNVLRTLAADVDPAAVQIGDLDGNLTQDIVVANRNANTISAYGNLGAGLFAQQSSFPSGNDPYYIALGDFVGNGRLDIATPNSGDNLVSVLSNQSTAPPRGDVNGDGAFDLNDLAPFVNVLVDPAGATPAARWAADFNEDAQTDGRDVVKFTDTLLHP